MTRTAGPLRVGIVGFGVSGAVFHGPLVDATPGLDISCVVTGNRDRARAARARYPDASISESVDELWGQADLVVIATPNRFHKDLALEAIDRGMPVVIDKPIASSVTEARELIDAGGKVSVFQNRRWDGDFMTVRELVENRRLGEILRFESRFERFRPEVSDTWRESGDAADGGGQLADLGSHLIDQALLLFGPPRSIYAEVDLRRPGAKADDDAFVALEHAGGERSHLWMGKAAPLAGPRMRISGLKGGVAIDGLDPQEGQLGEGISPGMPGYGEREPGRIVAEDGTMSSLPMKPGAYGEFYSGVAAWLMDDEPPPVDPEDSLRVLRVIEAARSSAAESRIVPFEL